MGDCLLFHLPLLRSGEKVDLFLILPAVQRSAVALLLLVQQQVGVGEDGYAFDVQDPLEKRKKWHEK